LTKTADNSAFQRGNFFLNFALTSNTDKHACAMNKPSFDISRNERSVEIKASGELTGSYAMAFRLHLLKLLQHGDSKSYKVNLQHVSAMDSSGIQLIHILKRVLTAVDASLVIEMPEEPGVKTYLIRMGILEMLS
jgi:anti-anti-sigma factor